MFSCVRVADVLRVLGDIVATNARARPSTATTVGIFPSCACARSVVDAFMKSLPCYTCCGRDVFFAAKRHASTRAFETNLVFKGIASKLPNEHLFVNCNALLLE